MTAECVYITAHDSTTLHISQSSTSNLPSNKEHWCKSFPPKCNFHQHLCPTSTFWSCLAFFSRNYMLCIMGAYHWAPSRQLSSTGNLVFKAHHLRWAPGIVAPAHATGQASCVHQCTMDATCPGSSPTSPCQMLASMAILVRWTSLPSLSSHTLICTTIVFMVPCLLISVHYHHFSI